MRALPQDLVYVHALATVAPTDLGEFYLSAAVATINPSVKLLDFNEFVKQKHMFLRVNKTIQELGLDLPGFVWSEIIGSYGHRHTFCLRNDSMDCCVYCKDVNLSACRRGFINPEWEELLSLLDDDDHLVIDSTNRGMRPYIVRGIIKLPP